MCGKQNLSVLSRESAQRYIARSTHFMSPWRSGQGRRTYFDKFVSQDLSGAGLNPAGSVGLDLNLQKLHYH